MTAEDCFLIKILKSLLHGETGSSIEHDYREIDFEKLYQAAKKNSVANMAAFLIEKSEIFPQDIKEKFNKQRLIITFQQLKCEKAFNEMCEIFRDCEAQGIILKGMILKSLYPDPFMRSMSDIDVYMEERDIQIIIPMMQQAGFNTGNLGIENHYEFLKYGDAKIEFHPELSALDSAYGKQVYSKLNNCDVPVAQAIDIWNHTEVFKNNKYVKQLTPEYHYLYVIMHMMNHFLTSGTGIRSILDVWVMNNHYAKTWARNIVESLLKKYGLLTFEKYALALADKWFDLNGISYLPNDVDQGILASFEQYIVESGTYGTLSQLLNQQMSFNPGAFGKVRYFASRFFLPADLMKQEYKAVQQHPFLLPAFWCYRVFEIFKERGKTAKYKMKTVINANEESMDKQKALIKSMKD